jgi:DNA (cytosine-5)-methyltransferase 1
MSCSIKIETRLDVPTITNQITTMDNIDITIELSKLSRKELLNKCRELNFVGYSSKNKPQLCEILRKHYDNREEVKPIQIPIESNEIQLTEEGRLIDVNRIEFIDLFCGIGGFHQALNRIKNTKCVFACDIDDKCRKTYEENYGIKPAGDITKVVIDNIPNFDILCGGFPCFIEGTQVLTQKGYKSIEDVILDDKLLTHTGKFQNVVNLQRKIYNGDLYELKIKYHSDIITCTEEHPFYVREKKIITKNNKVTQEFSDPLWKPAKELTINDYVGMVINTNENIPEFTFDKVVNQHKTDKETIVLDNKDQWYMMGYFIGDGWIDETIGIDGRCTHKIRFSINNKDEEEVFEKINNVIPITDTCDSGINKKCKKFECSDIVWYNILKEFGKYSQAKIIPEWVQDAPKECLHEFISGYMKADGSINRKECITLNTVSYNLAFGLQRLYLKLGNVCSISKFIRPATKIIEGCAVNQRNTYIVSVKPRKTSSFIEDNYVWYAPFKITKRCVIGTPVYNFEVDTDNSYVVENIIVHNCQSFSNSGKKQGFEDKRGQLFEYILSIATSKKPSFMFLENVKHIKRIDDGKVFEHIIKRINETGYTVSTTELSPHQLGIPQQRERIVFVCIRNDVYDKDKTLNLTPLSNIPIDIVKIFETDKTHTDKYKISSDDENVLNAWDKMIKKFDVGENLSPTILCKEFNSLYTNEELELLPTWKKDYMVKNKPLYIKYKIEWDKWLNDNREILSKKEIYSKLEWQTGKTKENDSIFNHFIQLRQSGIRVKKSEYFPTLVAIVQTPIYAKEKRFITPRECARLQSFPDDFILHKNDHTAYKQFGNAVNVDVVHFVMSNTLKAYNYC